MCEQSLVFVFASFISIIWYILYVVCVEWAAKQQNQQREKKNEGRQAIGRRENVWNCKIILQFILVEEAEKKQ